MRLFCKQSRVINSGQWSGSRSDASLPSWSIQILSLEPRELFFPLLWWCVQLRGLIYQPVSLCDYNEHSITSTCSRSHGALSRKHTSFVSSPPNCNIVTSAWPLFWLPLKFHACEEAEKENWCFSCTWSLPQHPFDSIFPSICTELPLSI